MIPFKTVNSRVIPLNIKNIDTDLIIPANFLTSTSKKGYGKHLFKRLRESDPSFPLNQKKYLHANILVSTSNFGCGSSREHAVWALLDAGIKVIISESFSDIFFNNSAKNGLLLITLPKYQVEAIMKKAQHSNLKLNIDLNKELITFPNNKSVPFKYNPFRKHCLEKGLDDIDYILSYSKDIDSFSKRREYDS